MWIPHSMLAPHCKDCWSSQHHLVINWIQLIGSLPAVVPPPLFFWSCGRGERGKNWIGPVLLEATGRQHPQILFGHSGCSTPLVWIKGPISGIGAGQEVRFQLSYPPLTLQWISLPPDGICFHFLSLPACVFLSLAVACIITFVFIFTRGPAANIGFQNILWSERQQGSVWNGNFNKNTIKEQERPQTLNVFWIQRLSEPTEITVFIWTAWTWIFFWADKWIYFYFWGFSREMGSRLFVIHAGECEVKWFAMHGFVGSLSAPSDKCSCLPLLWRWKIASL